MSWAKVHLVGSAEPVKIGEDVRVACGMLVPSAAAVGEIDLEFLGEDADIVSNRLCDSCVERFDASTRYLTALISGEESMHERRRRA
jgi:hypothetical protein